MKNDSCMHSIPMFFSSVYEWFLRLLLACVKVILRDENKISNTHNILAVITLQTFTSRKLIYHEKIYLNSFILGFNFPRSKGHTNSCKLQNTQNSNTFWHANQIINMLKTQ